MPHSCYPCAPTTSCASRHVGRVVRVDADSVEMRTREDETLVFALDDVEAFEGRDWDARFPDRRAKP